MPRLKNLDAMQAKKKSAATRKTKPKWAPASLLDSITGLDRKHWRYKWCDKDQANLSKKQAEGWEFCSQLKGDKVEHERPGTMIEGSEMTPSMTEYRDLVLMKMPEEMAKARDEYYAQRTKEHASNPSDKLRSDATAMGAEIEAKLTLLE